MATKTIGFLPEVFRSTANSKFLNATVDQLISEPNLKKVNGYVGRKFSPTFKPGDNYLPEVTDQRENYQLEPCVVVKNKDDEIQFLSSYTDLLGQISHYGGITDNHSRLFNNQVYSFDGKFDFDKLVNFSQYYWLPTGPESVDVFSGAVDLTNEFVVTRDLQKQAYTVSGFNAAENPDIILARGGTYEFRVSQPGHKFWIQVSPGLAGTVSGQSNVNGREVSGVVNNGEDEGTVTFNVPLASEQDFYINMPLLQEVDFATSLKYTDLNSQLVTNLVSKFGGIDGISSELAGKYILFVANDTSDESWTDYGPYSRGAWGDVAYDEGDVILSSQRSGIWQIQLENSDGIDLINLVWVQDLPENYKVLVKSGSLNANKMFYKNSLGLIVEMPLITAPLDELYYNDGSDQHFYGRIRLVEVAGYKIDINKEILGKTGYTSPNGVVFTNGLKVKFGTQVVQTEYADNEYYVEGVGTGIRLVKVDDLVTPEFKESSSSVSFDTYGFSEELYDESLNGPINPDYITINRSSVDLNAWSRSNRWFHNDVIIQTAKYNNKVVLFDQLQRASRPIIEFDPDLLLFNYGRIAKTNVDLLDFTVTDALNQVEGTVVAYVDGNNDNIDDNLTFAEAASLKPGMKVVFVNDTDPVVKNKVFQVEFIELNGDTLVHLVQLDGSIAENDVLVPAAGITVNLVPTNNVDILFNPAERQIVSTDNVGNATLLGVLSPNVGLIDSTSFWFNGQSWVLAQRKDSVNIPPVFDVINESGQSLSSLPASTFAGNKIFSYKEGEGVNDLVLGFPVSYRNFNNVGDLEFTNDFDSASFSTSENLNIVKVNVNTGFIPKIISRTELSKNNLWKTKTNRSRQFQIISHIATGTSNRFEIDILPKTVTFEPTIKVYVNNKILPKDKFSIVSTGVKYAVQINDSVAASSKVDILIDSDQVSALGYYEIPQNLDYNALNANFISLTLGQFRNHLTTISENVSDLVGDVPGFSNLRDLFVKDHSGSILQHSAPLVYSSLFLLHKDLNFVDAIGYAAQEYTKFKNRFLESYKLVINSGITDPRLGVDLILQTLNEVKNKQNPWYYSDMVPYDQNRKVTSYVVLDQELQEYEIESIFNDKQINNKAILVYLDGEQLTKDKDYEFSQTRPSIIFKNPLTFDQVIDIYTFYNTDGCYIPETPTKLGLYPKFTPEMYVDDSYQTPITVIRGHDGSITPKFNDLRDQLLLELELRIYNNIKVIYNRDNFDINEFIPGNFRDTEYSKIEFNRILSHSFLTWAGNNRVDFTSNSWFSSNNPWSWNYSKFRSILDNSFLPGYWRGAYKHFYDTDAPNIRPWEMLGFSEIPDWWIDTYGPAPYTGGNLVMWSDLEAGLIRFGERAGTYQQYARPGLTQIIPVTDSGELISPSEFLITAFNSSDASGDFTVGDEGPAESAWRRSSDYPFALQRTLALMKPAMYFGLLANVQSYTLNTSLDQVLSTDSKQHLTINDLHINGEVINGTTLRNAGYLNWIVDYLSSFGVDPVSHINDNLENIQCQLGYKAAGYTDQKYLTILAEQSSPSSTNDSIVIPDENYKVHLHKSSPIDRATYSAVIIEKTNLGYSVRGYNTRLPYFTIIPSEPNSNNYQVSVLGTTGTIYKNYKRAKVTIPYGYEFRNKQQVVDFLISYERYLASQGFIFNDFSRELATTKNWELSVKEFLTWTQQGWGPGNVIVVSPISNSISLRTDTSVVDEISNNPSGSKILDVGFNPIKPSQFSINRDGENFVLAAMPEITIGLIDLHLVQYEHVLVFDNQTLFNDIIYSPELGNRQYRLKLVGNKTAGWNGQVSPEGFVFSNAVFEEWNTGKDYRKGDIVKFKGLYYSALSNITAADSFNFGMWRQIDKDKLKAGVLQNLSTNAQKFENMYDIDRQVDDEQIDDFGLGLLGYRKRSYLTDLRINATTQAKFYQGYIRDKGTKDAVTALTSASFNNLKGEVTFNEEWAFRVGEYGALETNQYVEVQLDDSIFTRTPIAFSLLNDDETAQSSDVVGIFKNTLFKQPLSFKKNIFLNRDDSSTYEDDIQTAGFVNLNDVDATIFDIQNYQAADGIVQNIYSGFKIWVAKDVTRDWNVYRCDETPIRVSKVEYELDRFVTLTMSQAHHLAINEVFAVVGFNSDIDSFYKVERIDSPNTVFVSISAAVEAVLVNTPIVEDDGAVFKLRSLRVDHLSDVHNYVPRLGWLTTDKVWVESDTTDNTWATYKKNLPWSFVDEVKVDKNEVITGANFGYSVAVNSTGIVGVVGSPTAGPIVDQQMTLGNGAIRLLVKGQNNEYSVSSSLTLEQPGISKLGFSVGIAGNTIVTGAPESEAIENSFANAGKVAICSTLNNELRVEHIILNNSAEAFFGYSVAISQDGKWLYAGSPGANEVKAFRREEVGTHTEVIITDNSTYLFPLAFTPHSDLSISVTVGSHVLIPGEEFTIHNAAGNLTWHGNGALSLNGYSTYNYIEFKNILPTNTYIVKQSSYYDEVATISTVNSDPGDRFGHAIHTNADGSVLVVGAPDRTGSGEYKSGEAYVFNRYIQEFIGNGAATSFTLGQSYNSVYLPQIFVDGIEVVSPNVTAVGVTVTFTTAPAVNSKIRVELNTFGEPTQVLTANALPTQAKFGSSVCIAESGKTIFVGSLGYSNNLQFGGAVFRFTDEAHEFNSSLSTVTAAGYSNKKIKINNRRVSIPAGNAAAVVNYLNTSTGITGLSATNENGYLRLSFMSTANEKFSVLSDDATLTVSPYILTQTIVSPRSTGKFGSAVSYVESTSNLAISSEGAETLEHFIIDNGTVTLDGNSTVVYDKIPNTGSVFIFEELSNSAKTATNPTMFGLIDDLAPEGIDPGDNFGASVAITARAVFIGANYGESRGTALPTIAETTDAGQVFYFANPTATKGWEKIQQQERKIDINSLTKMFLYDRKSQVILSRLDVIDPVKGKILGVADQEIEYRTSFDPATYNRGVNTSVSIDEDFHFGSAQVGKVWWNLDKVRYVDYEQSTLSYRIKNWGKLFPGSEIEIAEWVESSVPPSEYSGDGVPVYSNDNSAYVQETVIDSTGAIRLVYYFWVKNKLDVDTLLPFRKMHTSAIAELIRSPSTQDIPYAELLQDNSVALVNAANFISSNDTILHVDYAAIQNSNIIHNEYELVAENSNKAVIPERVVNKLIDSLTGEDKFSNIVPDIKLTAAEKYGIGLRPRQTMFVNRIGAVKNFVKHVNHVFMQYPITNEFDLSKLYLSEEAPAMWDPVANKNIKVASLEELSYLDVTQLVTGQRVLVESDLNFNGNWTIQEFTQNVGFSVVRSQSYDTTDYWSVENWYDPTFDPSVKPTYTVETKKDIAKLALNEGNIIHVKNSGAGKFIIYRTDESLNLVTVGVEDGTIQLADALWAHSTNQIGFSNDTFDTVKFDLNPTAELRNIFSAVREDIFVDELYGQFNQLFFVLLNYVLSEQRSVDWAFKTSFVSIIHNLRSLEQYPNYIRDNQTFFEDYINEVKPYRTKIREYITSYDGLDTNAMYATDFDLPSYYDSDFEVWRSPSGEHARDELLLTTESEYSDWSNNHAYYIDSVTITNQGHGYSAPPVLTVVGGGGTGAKLEAVIDYYFGSVIKINVIDSGSGYTSTPTIEIQGDGIVGGKQTLVCYPNLRNDKIRSFDSTIKFDRITYSSDVKQWAANTTFDAGDIVAYANKAYRVNATITTGLYFVYSDYTAIDDADLETAADRVMALYSPTVGMPAKDLARIFYGTTYEANKVDGLRYAESTDLLDTNIQSEFTDLELGTRPEDINVIGGAFVDVWNSHAPEELLPGIMFDTLDLRVFTVNLAAPTESPLGFRISKVMAVDHRTVFDDNDTVFDDNNTTLYEILSDNMWEFRRICAAATTELAQDLLIGDSVIHVVDASKLPSPSPGYPTPGVVYINGEKITYYVLDIYTNTLSQIRRGAWGTGAPARHFAGSRVVDASLEQKLPSYISTSGNNVGRQTDESTDWQFDNRTLDTGITPQALFIQACPSYLPWPPGQTGPYTDPNASNTRFDDNGAAEPNQGHAAEIDIHWVTTTLQPGDVGYSDEIGADNTVKIGYNLQSEPIHTFDQDPFDSYMVS